MRCVIAFAFPDEPAWAERDATEILDLFGKTKDVITWYPVFTAELIGSLQRPRSLTMHIVEAVDAAQTAPFVGYMIEALGDAAPGPMVKLLDRASGKVRKKVAEQLAEVAHPEVARALARYAHDKQCRAAVKAFVEAHPRLAAAALAEVVGAGGKAADAARMLLQKLGQEEAAEPEGGASVTPRRARTRGTRGDPRRAGADGRGFRGRASERPRLPRRGRAEQSPAETPVVKNLEPLHVEEKDRVGPGPARPVRTGDAADGAHHRPRHDRGMGLPAERSRPAIAEDGRGGSERPSRRSRAMGSSIAFTTHPSSCTPRATKSPSRSGTKRPPRSSTADGLDVAYALERFGLAALPGAITHVSWQSRTGS